MKSSSDRPRNRLWHPFADMAKVAANEFVVDRGQGVWIFDSEGRRYLDASAGLWYCNVGHGRRALAEVAARQMLRLAGYQTFDRFANRPALQLAERVCQLAPMAEGNAAFFTNGGSDAIDSGAKIARRFWALQGKPERRFIISREGGYHGVNAFGTSLSGIEANATGWGTLVPETLVVPRHDIAALAETMEAHSGEIAAFIGEIVQGAGGVHPPAPDYWPAVQELCRAHDVLLIADEVVTGFGRLGTWFGAERYEIDADLILGAKGLSSGYLPIGVVIVSSRLLDVLWAGDAGAFRHGYTYSGHPAACAVALANLEILEKEKLLARVQELEPVMAKELEALSAHPLVEEVRCAGLLGGVQLTEQALIADPAIAERVVSGARERGLLIRNLLGRTLQVSPPFVIDDHGLRSIAETLRETLDALLSPEQSTAAATT
jgi:putrescine aminotransferase